MITGYFVKIKELPEVDAFEQRLNELPPQVKTKILSYNTWPEQMSRLCGKLLLAKLLTDNNSMGSISLNNLQYNEFAKPYFKTDFDFNIAHTEGVVICIASTGHNIGVDIEKIKDTDIAALIDYFTNDEWAHINNNAQKTEAFLKMWVRKEAVIKAMGKGLFQPMNEISVLHDEVLAEEKRFFVKDIFIDNGYAASVATDEQNSDIKLWEINIDKLLAMPVAGND